MKRDFLFALRSLRRSPGFTAIAVLSLALGIGANTAIFTLFDQVLLRLLPVRDPESLVMVASRGSHSGNNRGMNVISYPMFEDYRERNDVFSGVVARFGTEVNLGWDDSTERTAAELVSGDYFEVLGIGAAAVSSARVKVRPAPTRWSSSSTSSGVIVLPATLRWWGRRYASTGIR